MNVRCVPGFGIAVLLSVLSLAGECIGAGGGTWHEWTCKRVDSDNQTASVAIRANVPTSGDFLTWPYSKIENAHSTYAQASV